MASLDDKTKNLVIKSGKAYTYSGKLVKDAEKLLADVKNLKR